MEDEESGKRNPFARRMYLRSHSQEQTIIRKLSFYKGKIVLTLVTSVFLDLVEAFGMRYFGVGSLVLHYYFALKLFGEFTLNETFWLFLAN